MPHKFPWRVRVWQFLFCPNLIPLQGKISSLRRSYDSRLGFRCIKWMSWSTLLIRWSCRRHWRWSGFGVRRGRCIRAQCGFLWNFWSAPVLFAKWILSVLSFFLSVWFPTCFGFLNAREVLSFSLCTYLGLFWWNRHLEGWNRDKSYRVRDHRLV